MKVTKIHCERCNKELPNKNAYYPRNGIIGYARGPERPSAEVRGPATIDIEADTGSPIHLRLELSVPENIDLCLDCTDAAIPEAVANLQERMQKILTTRATTKMLGQTKMPIMEEDEMAKIAPGLLEAMQRSKLKMRPV